jgi:exodeoxyribonuclease V
MPNENTEFQMSALPAFAIPLERQVSAAELEAAKDPLPPANAALEGDQADAYAKIIAYIDSIDTDPADISQSLDDEEAELLPFVAPFVLTGLAGTGKTTLISRVIEYALQKYGPPDIDPDTGRPCGNRVVVCSPTGKAASVLNAKLPLSVKKHIRAQTIHSFIYAIPRDAREELFNRLLNAEMEWTVATPDQKGAARAKMEGIQREIDELTSQGKGTLTFTKREPYALHRETIVAFVDEASMVGKELASDLLAMGRPVIFLGDGNQLPPVNDDYGVNLRKPNEPCAKLTQIRRQAGDSGILKLSHDILKLKRLPDAAARASYNDVTWSPHRNPLRHLAPGPVTSSFSIPQFIVYTNDTRHGINRTIRQHVYGVPGTAFGNNPFNFLPMPGETLMIDENAPMLNLMKGDEIKVLNVKHYIPSNPYVGGKKIKTIQDEHYYTALIEFEDVKGLRRELPIFLNDLMLTMQHPMGIDARKASATEQRKLFSAKRAGGTGSENVGKGALSVMFKYGITCHKSQGSEWDSVVLFNDKPRDSYVEYLYTGVTRARKHLTIVG